MIIMENVYKFDDLYPEINHYKFNSFQQLGMRNF